MTTPSTRDQIRALVAQARSGAGDVDERLREALRLLDTLAPATPPRNPIDALRVALDYGMEREWPLDVREAFARTLPKLQITTRWWVDEGDDVGNRYDSITGRVVGRIRRGTEGRWRATLPEERPAAASLEGAQADVDEQLSGWVLGGGPVMVYRVGVDLRGYDGTLHSATIELPLNWEPITPPEEEQPDASWLRHVRPADGDVRLGWVQAPAQPEDAEPTTDERSYAPEDLLLEEEAP